MKECDNVAHHINDFESTFDQMCAQQMNIDDKMKAIFLLFSLPSSWDTFARRLAILHPMVLLCTIVSLELFLQRKLDARLWVACIMAKIIMCKKKANNAEVTLDSVILTKMARIVMLNLVANQSLVVRRIFSSTFVMSMVI